MGIGWVGDCGGEVHAKAFGCAGAFDLAVDVRDDSIVSIYGAAQRQDSVHPIRA